MGHGSYQSCSAALSGEPSNSAKSHLTVVLRVNGFAWPAWVLQSDTKVGSVQDDRTYGDADPNDTEFGHAWYRMFGWSLSSSEKDGDGRGWLTAHPWEVVPGGLNGVEQALTYLKEGKNSAKEFLIRIEESFA